MPINRNSKDYIEGANAERIRIAARDAARRALDANPSLPDVAREVAKHLSRDNARKTRIMQRSPYVFAAMDAGELLQASSHELAARELKELGIEAGDNDPLAILDAHHAGRTYALTKFRSLASKAVRHPRRGCSAATARRTTRPTVVS